MFLETLKEASQNIFLKILSVYIFHKGVAKLSFKSLSALMNSDFYWL